MIHFWLCLSAVAAGVMNAIAGGGTLLTFPALMFALGPGATTTANMTSPIALMPGTCASAWGFRRELAACRKWVVWLTVPSILGGTLGSLLLIYLEERIFRAVVPWLVLLAAVLFLVQPRVV